MVSLSSRNIKTTSELRESMGKDLRWKKEKKGAKRNKRKMVENVVDFHYD